MTLQLFVSIVCGIALTAAFVGLVAGIYAVLTFDRRYGKQNQN